MSLLNSCSWNEIMELGLYSSAICFVFIGYLIHSIFQNNTDKNDNNWQQDIMCNKALNLFVKIAVKFKKTQYTEKTYIPSIKFKGIVDNDDEYKNKDEHDIIIEPLHDISEICNKKASECGKLIELSKIMDEYNNTNNNDNFYNKYTNNNGIIFILDYFHHFLSFHNRNSDQFQSVYEMFNNHDVCDPFKCNLIRRRYRNCIMNKNKNDKQFEDYKLLCFKDILSTIHCHICHSFDMGSKLTINERKQIDDIRYDENNSNNNNNNPKMIKLRDILNEKRLKSEMITNNNTNSRNNKFSSNLYQTQINDESNDDKISISKYSYSFPFLYKEQFKNSQKKHHSLWKYCDLYVPPKHLTLKDELISNKLYFINIDSWNFIMEKANSLIQTVNARKSWAKIEKYCKFAQHLISHPIHFGYIECSEITLNHLIVLRIYCGNDDFQKIFTKTYRKTNNHQTLKDIINIHSNFHHFGKYLKESIEVFGTEYLYGIIKTMYHGINKEMIFTSTSTSIYGPLSTTYEWQVAVQFSCNIGLVLELIPSDDTKYFQCDWISPFSFEAELLFIGGFQPINFINIANAQFGYQYDRYIKALRLIDTMTNGIYFLNDPSDIHKIRIKRKLCGLDVAKIKLSSITLFDKQLCLALIYHELNRNGYKNDKYEQIAELPHLHKYIDQLLHGICLNKQRITINWKSLNVNILKKCDKWGWGYIGYSFLRLLFGNKHYEGINLDIFQALYPNISTIRILDLSSIDTNFLNDIYEFLQNNKQNKINYIELNVSTEYKYSNIFEQCSLFKSKFKNIGFNLWNLKDQKTWNLNDKIAIKKL